MVPGPAPAPDEQPVSYKDKLCHSIFAEAFRKPWIRTQLVRRRNGLPYRYASEAALFVDCGSDINIVKETVFNSDRETLMGPGAVEYIIEPIRVSTFKTGANVLCTKFVTNASFFIAGIEYLADIFISKDAALGRVWGTPALLRHQAQLVFDPRTPAVRLAARDDADRHQLPRAKQVLRGYTCPVAQVEAMCRPLPVRMVAHQAWR
jgi:hypothetical protein